ncbi:MAG: fumarylacetoacetate hydrolase family protein [Hyphomicrobiales bacterium]
MSFAFAPAPPVSLAVAGSEARFPVRRVYCVGRNYAEHVREMGGEVGRDPPFFFMKPADALVTDGRFPYPASSSDVHHEVELVVALGPGATIFGHAVGLDMTRRDLQAAAKKLGRPWEVAKGFDHSAPIGAIVPAGEALASGAITLDVNGARRQAGDLSEMIWNVPEIIVELGRLFSLQPGDLIFTGTPSGVGPVARGDRLDAEIAGIGSLHVEVL